MWTTAKKYLPFVVVAALAIYFAPQILSLMPASIRRVFMRAA